MQSIKDKVKTFRLRRCNPTTRH